MELRSAANSPVNINSSPGAKRSRSPICWAAAAQLRSCSFQGSTGAARSALRIEALHLSGLGMAEEVRALGEASPETSLQWPWDAIWVSMGHGKMICFFPMRQKNLFVS